MQTFLPLSEPGSVAIAVASMAHAVPRNEAYNHVLIDPLASNFLEQMEKFTEGNSGIAYALSKLGMVLMVEDQAWAWGQKGAHRIGIAG